MALKRVIDDLFVVGQAAFLCSEVAKTIGRTGNTPFYFVRDALQRGLLHREIGFSDAEANTQKTKAKIRSLAAIEETIQQNHREIEAETANPK